MNAEQALSLLWFELSLSLLSVGGVIVLAPEQHRYLVDEQGWLTDAQFQTSITLAQAAPGPNVLFLALWGWHVGLNAGTASGVPGLAWGSALLGAFICLLGTLLPTSMLTVAVSRWTQRHQQRQGVRALRLGLAPVVVGAMAATAWLLGSAPGAPEASIASVAPNGASDRLAPAFWALSVMAAVVVWRFQVHLLILLAAGAVAGLMLSFSPA